MVQDRPCQNQIAKPLNILPHNVRLLVRHGTVPLVMTVVRVVVQDVRVADVLAEHRWRNLCSIGRVLVGD